MTTTTPASAAEQLQVLLNGPALEAPPGVTSNLIDPPNQLLQSRVDYIVCLVIATLALTTRIYTKIRITRSVSAADYFIFLGWGIYVGIFVCSWLGANAAPGVHQWNLQLKDFGKLLYYTYIGSILYSPSIFFIKLSILLQYIEMFAPMNFRNTIFWMSHILIWTNFAFYSTSTFILIFACKPIAKAWDPLIKDGHCISVLPLYMAGGAFNSISDIAILTLPQLSVWRLQMKLKRKIQVSVIFLLGSLACFSAIVRSVYTVKLLNTNDLAFYTWKDITWISPEISFGIIVACLPNLAAFSRTIQEPKLMIRIRSSGVSLFRSRVAGSGKGTDDLPFQGSNTAAIRKANKSWPQGYENLDDREALTKSSMIAAEPGRKIDYYHQIKMAT